MLKSGARLGTNRAIAQFLVTDQQSQLSHICQQCMSTSETQAVDAREYVTYAQLIIVARVRVRRTRTCRTGCAHRRTQNFSNCSSRCG